MTVNGPPPEWDDIVANSAEIPTSLDLLNAQRRRERPGAMRASTAREAILKSGRPNAQAALVRRRASRDPR